MPVAQASPDAAMGNSCARRAPPANANEKLQEELPGECFPTRMPPSPHVWWDGSKVWRWETGEWVDTTPLQTEGAAKLQMPASPKE